jgi:hypothetical protein
MRRTPPAPHGSPATSDDSMGPARGSPPATPQPGSTRTPSRDGSHARVQSHEERAIHACSPPARPSSVSESLAKNRSNADRVVYLVPPNWITSSRTPRSPWRAQRKRVLAAVDRPTRRLGISVAACASVSSSSSRPIATVRTPCRPLLAAARKQTLDCTKGATHSWNYQGCCAGFCLGVTLGRSAGSALG